MGFNSQFKNYNARYGNIRYAALGGSSYSSVVNESVTTGQSFSAAASYISVLSEIVSALDVLSGALKISFSTSDSVTSADGAALTVVYNTSLGESILTADMQGCNNDYTYNISETLVCTDSQLAGTLFSTFYNEYAGVSDSAVMFGNMRTPLQRIFSIIKENRSF